MKRQAVISATFIIVMLAVATIFVEVVSAQQAIASSEKSAAPTQHSPDRVIIRPGPIYRPPIYLPPPYIPPIVIVV